MSAAVLSPASVTTEAHAVLHMALATTALWPECGKAREEVFSAVVTLGCALKGCAEGGRDEKAAEAAEAADDLIRVMNEHCGTGWGGAL